MQEASDMLGDASKVADRWASLENLRTQVGKLFTQSRREKIIRVSLLLVAFVGPGSDAPHDQRQAPCPERAAMTLDDNTSLTMSNVRVTGYDEVICAGRNSRVNIVNTEVTR